MSLAMPLGALPRPGTDRRVGPARGRQGAIAEFLTGKEPNTRDAWVVCTRDRSSASRRPAWRFTSPASPSTVLRVCSPWSTGRRGISAGSWTPSAARAPRRVSPMFRGRRRLGGRGGCARFVVVPDCCGRCGNIVARCLCAYRSRRRASEERPSSACVATRATSSALLDCGEQPIHRSVSSSSSTFTCGAAGNVFSSSVTWQYRTDCPFTDESLCVG